MKQKTVHRTPQLGTTRRYVLELAKQGRTAHEIADILEITPSTVYRHLLHLINDGLLEGYQRQRRYAALPNSVRNQLLELAKQGKTVREIAGILEIAESTVRCHLRPLVKDGLLESRQRQRRYAALPNSVRNQLLELAKQGKTVREIANVLKISEVTVRWYLRRLVKDGLLEDYRQQHCPRRHQVLELANQGKTISEIANTLKITVTTVYRHLRYFVDNGLLKNYPYYRLRTSHPNSTHN